MQWGLSAGGDQHLVADGGPDPQPGLVQPALVGSCHAGIRDLALAPGLLGIPEDRDAALILSLGYPADRPLAPVRNPKRRPFDEVVHWGRW